MRSCLETTEIPDGPQCHYVILEFNATYENGPPGVERTTTIRGDDGKYRVAGYYFV